MSRVVLIGDRCSARTARCTRAGARCDAPCSRPRRSRCRDPTSAAPRPHGKPAAAGPAHHRRTAGPPDAIGATSAAGRAVTGAGAWAMAAEQAMVASAAITVITKKGSEDQKRKFCEIIKSRYNH